MLLTTLLIVFFILTSIIAYRAYRYKKMQEEMKLKEKYDKMTYFEDTFKKFDTIKEKGENYEV